MRGGYRFLEHMTDAVIEAYGGTLAEAFENAATALNDTMVDVRTVDPVEKISISVKGTDLKQLLFEWLDKVMLILLVDRFVMRTFHVNILERQSEYSLQATAEGEPLDLQKHPYKVEIKAVTYHDMEIDRTESKTTVRFILDL